MIWPIISKDSFISYNSMSNFYAPAIPTAPLIPLSLCIGTASLERPIYNHFIYFFLAMLGLRGSMGFSLVVGRGATVQSQPVGFSLWWLLSLWRTRSTVCGLSSCGFWALECRLESWRTQHNGFHETQSSLKPLSEALFHIIHTLLIYMVSTRENRYKGCLGLEKMNNIHISTQMNPKGESY